MSLIKYIFLGLLSMYGVATLVVTKLLNVNSVSLVDSDESYSELNNLEGIFNVRINEKGKFLSKCVSAKPDPDCLISENNASANLRKIHSITELTVKLGNYKVIFNPVNLCSDRPRIFIAYYVRANQFFERYVIRKTIANIKFYNRYSLKVGFFIGESYENRNLLLQEYKKYKDIIQFSFEDNEFQSTLSFMLSVKWLYDNCESIFYYMKCDTSTFVNLHNIINKEIPILREKLYTGSGILIENEKVERDLNKPKMIYSDIFPYDSYPPHFDKSFSIFTSKSLEKFIDNFNQVDPIYLLDEYIGLLSKASDIELNNIEGKITDLNRLESTQDLSNIFEVRNLSPIGLYNVWFFFKDVLAEPNGNEVEELLVN